MADGDVVKLAENVIKENGEIALYMVASAVAYAVLDGYIGVSRYVPEQVRPFAPGIVGLCAVAAGYYMKNKIVMGLGSGLVAYNLVTFATPIAMQATGQLLAAKAQ